MMDPIGVAPFASAASAAAAAVATSTSRGGQLSGVMWMVGLGLAVVLVGMTICALVLHGRLNELQETQMSAGIYEGDGEGLDRDAPPKKPPTPDARVQCYAINVHVVGSDALQVAAPPEQAVEERLPIRCETSGRNTVAICRYKVAQWLVLQEATGGQARLLYDAVLQGRARYGMVAGVFVRLFTPDALLSVTAGGPPAPTEDALRMLQTSLPTRADGKRGAAFRGRWHRKKATPADGAVREGFREHEDDTNGTGLGSPTAVPSPHAELPDDPTSWPSALRALDVRALLACPLQAAAPMYMPAGQRCKYDVVLPLGSAEPAQLSALFKGASVGGGVAGGSRRLMVLAW